jgi:hypothetical protein
MRTLFRYIVKNLLHLQGSLVSSQFLPYYCTSQQWAMNSDLKYYQIHSARFTRHDLNIAQTKILVPVVSKPWRFPLQHLSILTISLEDRLFPNSKQNKLFPSLARNHEVYQFCKCCGHCNSGFTSYNRPVYSWHHSGGDDGHPVGGGQSADGHEREDNDDR